MAPGWCLLLGAQFSPGGALLSLGKGKGARWGPLVWNSVFDLKFGINYQNKTEKRSLSLNFRLLHGVKSVFNGVKRVKPITGH